MCCYKNNHRKYIPENNKNEIENKKFSQNSFSRRVTLHVASDYFWKDNRVQRFLCASSRSRDRVKIDELSMNFVSEVVHLTTVAERIKALKSSWNSTTFNFIVFSGDWEIAMRHRTRMWSSFYVRVALGCVEQWCTLNVDVNKYRFTFIFNHKPGTLHKRTLNQ
jgi:hypothetical protein